MSKSRDTLLAFLAGAAAGALLGLLFAPDTGKNTREKLSFQLEKYREQLKEMLAELVHDHEEIDTVAKMEGERVVDEARGKAEQLLHDVEALIADIKSHNNHA